MMWFTHKKRLTANGKKCFAMVVNGKKHDIPKLKVGNVDMENKEVKYIGDIFNSSGNNTDLMEDRTNKGMGCLATTMSLCEDVTLGTYTL